MMTADPRSVRLTVQCHVGWVEFARPPVNAIHFQMLDQIHDVLAATLADPEVRVVVMASAVDRYFSAGADLQAFKTMPADGMERWVRKCHDIVRLLRSSPKPLLAAINGTAVGGGLEMTLHCDLRFAAENARFGQPEIQIAFIPPVGATQALARLIGRPRAIRYLYEGRMVGASEALDWGLIDEVVAADRLRDHVQAYGEALAAKPASALAAIRRTITLGGSMSFDQGLELEMQSAVELAATADFREGVAAFLEKRPPRWDGR